MGRFKKRLVLLTEAEEQAKKKQETLKKQKDVYKRQSKNRNPVRRSDWKCCGGNGNILLPYCKGCLLYTSFYRIKSNVQIKIGKQNSEYQVKCGTDRVFRHSRSKPHGGV